VNRFIADENFPHPSFHLLRAHGVDVIHIGVETPSIDDVDVIRAAVEQGRILLTLDRDHGELIFAKLVPPPPGVIYFRVPQYRPEALGNELIQLLEAGVNFDGSFTVVSAGGFRQKPL
jgi:predicted nuclease of predicted toxin-antitoxin system